jgi:hypothetical protein
MPRFSGAWGVKGKLAGSFLGESGKKALGVLGFAVSADFEVEMGTC